MILVIGDLILDEVILTNSYKNSPEAPVPLLIPNKKIYFLGGAANVANNIKKFGENIELVGLKDSNKFKSTKILQKLLKKNFIKNKLFQTTKFVPPLKKRIFCNNKIILRIDYEKKNYNDKFSKIFSYIKKNIYKFSLVIISDYKKGTFNKNNIKKLVNFVRENKKIIVCNPKINPISYYDGCDIIIPNEKEFNSFFNKKLNLKDKIKVFFEKNPGINHLIITRGSNKVIHSTKNKISYYDVKKIVVSDVTGASDTFVAILAIFLKNNFSLKKSIIKAINASSKVVAKKYTSFVKPNKI